MKQVRLILDHEGNFMSEDIGFWNNQPLVDIPEEEWEDYEETVSRYNSWQDRMGAMGEEIKLKEILARKPKHEPF